MVKFAKRWLNRISMLLVAMTVGGVAQISFHVAYLLISMFIIRDHNESLEQIEYAARISIAVATTVFVMFRARSGLPANDDVPTLIQTDFQADTLPSGRERNIRWKLFDISEQGNGNTT